MGKILRFQRPEIKAQDVITAEHSGVLLFFNTISGCGRVRLRKSPCSLVHVHARTMQPYVTENCMRGWKVGEGVATPGIGDWIVLTLHPPYHPQVVKHGAIASHWAVIPVL